MRMSLKFDKTATEAFIHIHRHIQTNMGWKKEQICANELVPRRETACK